jgi:hypothetical protein
MLQGPLKNQFMGSESFDRAVAITIEAVGALFENPGNGFTAYQLLNRWYGFVFFHFKDRTAGQALTVTITSFPIRFIDIRHSTPIRQQAGPSFI